LIWAKTFTLLVYFVPVEVRLHSAGCVWADRLAVAQVACAGHAYFRAASAVLSSPL
jgi:hypothetical protein